MLKSGIIYEIKGKGFVHMECYNEKSQNIDSPWRGTIIHKIIYQAVAGENSCEICKNQFDERKLK